MTYAGIRRRLAIALGSALKDSRSYMYGMPWDIEFAHNCHGIKRGEQIQSGNITWTVTEVGHSSCIVTGKPSTQRVWISNIEQMKHRIFPQRIKTSR